MKECSKSIPRRLSQVNFITKYFHGNGIDIGGKPDPLVLYKELFPLVKDIKTWDIEDGDAQFLEDVPNEAYDFVHSSHCLEHLNDPYEGLKNWFRVLKKGGYLIVTVPDEDLYEQGLFPSTFNTDHKWTFTINKKRSWSQQSINIFDLMNSLDEYAIVEKIELLNATYRYSLPRYDQTLTPIAECGIEIIVRKALPEEIDIGGNFLNKSDSDVDEEVLIHLNQYKDDIETLKKSNATKKPFQNKNRLK